jgi:hypothetical protein
MITVEVVVVAGECVPEEPDVLLEEWVDYEAMAVVVIHWVASKETM